MEGPALVSAARSVGVALGSGASVLVVLAQPPSVVLVVVFLAAGVTIILTSLDKPGKLAIPAFVVGTFLVIVAALATLAQA